jgi:hypothetical protein
MCCAELQLPLVHFCTQRPNRLGYVTQLCTHCKIPF